MSEAITTIVQLLNGQTSQKQSQTVQIEPVTENLIQFLKQQKAGFTLEGRVQQSLNQQILVSTQKGAFKLTPPPPNIQHNQTILLKVTNVTPDLKLSIEVPKQPSQNLQTIQIRSSQIVEASLNLNQTAQKVFNNNHLNVAEKVNINISLHNSQEGFPKNIYDPIQLQNLFKGNKVQILGHITQNPKTQNIQINTELGIIHHKGDSLKLPLNKTLLFDLFIDKKEILNYIRKAVPSKESFLWPEIEKSLKTLAQQPQQNFANTLNFFIPKPGPSLGSSLLFFLSVLKGGSLQNLLNEDTVKQLKSQPNLLNNLQSEFSDIQKQIDIKADWKLYQIPLLDHQTLQTIKFFIHKDPNETHPSYDEEDKKNHFVIETEFSQIGAFQLEGLVRKKHISLNIRTEKEFSLQIKKDIQTVFIDTAELYQFSGSVLFETLDHIQPFETTLNDLNKIGDGFFT